MEKEIKKIIGVGFENGVFSKRDKVLRQIKELCRYRLDVVGLNGEKLNWSDIYDANDTNKLFSVIYSDRKMRAQKNTMSDRPQFLREAIINNRVIRLEIYFGHEKLEKIYDFRNENYKDDSSFGDYTEYGIFDGINLKGIRGVEEAHDVLVKAEVGYLRLRNTVSDWEHSSEVMRLVDNSIDLESFQCLIHGFDYLKEKGSIQKPEDILGYYHSIRLRFFLETIDKMFGV